MTLFNWFFIIVFVFCFLYDLYCNWDRIGDIEDTPKRQTTIAEGEEIYKHPLLVELGIKDPFRDYEVINDDEEPLLVTEVEYYNDSRGERQYRTIHLLE